MADRRAVIESHRSDRSPKPVERIRALVEEQVRTTRVGPHETGHDDPDLRTILVRACLHSEFRSRARIQPLKAWPNGELNGLCVRRWTQTDADGKPIGVGEEARRRD
jgi:hypothetical protein